MPPKAQIGTYQVLSLVGGSTQFSSSAPALQARLLVVFIGPDRDEVLSTWLSSAWTHGLTLAAFMLMVDVSENNVGSTLSTLVKYRSANPVEVFHDGTEEISYLYCRGMVESYTLGLNVCMARPVDFGQIIEAVR